MSQQTIGKSTETRPVASQPPRIVELDAIRGLAILLVLVFHYVVCNVQPEAGPLLAGIKRVFSLSWAGVDLFFVLSGFLIGGILLKYHDAENYFSAFYMRRAARLMPLYLLSVALYAGLTQVTPGTSAEQWLFVGRAEPLPIWSYLLYAQNFLMASGQNWGGHWLAPTWSLAVEEQFYLIAPLLLRVVPREKLAGALALLIAAGILCRAVMFARTGLWLPGYVLLVTRWDALFIGIWGALVLADPALRARIEAQAHRLPRVLAVMLLGVAVLTALGVNMDSAGMAMFGFTYLALTSAVAVAVALLVKTRWTALLFRNAALARLGTISYGVYLLHQAVLGLVCLILHGGTPAITGLDGLLVAGLATLITIGLADLSWRLFEKPILDLGQRWTYRRPGAEVAPGAQQAGVTA